jgi:hypothetical protein
LRDPGSIAIGSCLPEQSESDCFVPPLPALAGNRQRVLAERVGLIGSTVEQTDLTEVDTHDGLEEEHADRLVSYERLVSRD